MPSAKKSKVKEIIEQHQEPVTIAEALEPAKEKLKASFGPVPYEFKDIFVSTPTGIRVNQSFDRTKTAIQFAENMTPDRAEKDFLEDRGFGYNEAKGRRQWERTDEATPGANAIDTKRIAQELVEQRREIMGLGRER